MHMQSSSSGGVINILTILPLLLLVTFYTIPTCQGAEFCTNPVKYCYGYDQYCCESVTASQYCCPFSWRSIYNKNKTTRSPAFSTSSTMTIIKIVSAVFVGIFIFFGSLRLLIILCAHCKSKQTAPTDSGTTGTAVVIDYTPASLSSSPPNHQNNPWVTMPPPPPYSDPLPLSNTSPSPPPYSTHDRNQGIQMQAFYSNNS